MPSPPLWAQRNASRVFSLITFDAEGAIKRVADEIRGGTAARNFKRAALAIKDARIVARGRGMLIGWRGALLAEDESDIVDRTIALTGFTPYYTSSGFGYHCNVQGIILQKHALARLFERAIQPPEMVATTLLNPAFLQVFSDSNFDEANLGFAVPFQSGRLVGSVEYARGAQNQLYPTFAIRTWLPDPLDRFIWTNKASRSLLKAYEVDKKRQFLKLIGAAETGPPSALIDKPYVLFDLR